MGIKHGPEMPHPPDIGGFNLEYEDGTPTNQDHVLIVSGTLDMTD